MKVFQGDSRSPAIKTKYSRSVIPPIFASSILLTTGYSNESLMQAQGQVGCLDVDCAC